MRENRLQTSASAAGFLLHVCCCSTSFAPYWNPAMQKYLNFFEEFIRNPRQMGAIAPSSPQLAEAITSWPRLEKANVVVEVGPGTGAFTPYILERLKPGAKFFALEINENLCDKLQKRHPEVEIYCDCATKIQKYLNQIGARQADCIVSSLPWALFDAELQGNLMSALYDALRPGGRLVTFAYLQGTIMPSGRRFHKCLQNHFEKVSRSSVVWRNFPPAFVYRCVKSKQADAAAA
jgi:phosphatidylethanolamine/phosphatidyl-N-methylethanolamine N-methyltransferase